MLIVFQIVVAIAVLVAIAFMLRGGGARHQAIRRIIFLAFILIVASSVFFPQFWTWLANLVGIGRGADLITYLLVLTFLGYVATTHRRFRSIENDVTELARQMALDRAVSPDASDAPTRRD
ncbi:hypothetical protein GCM10009819_27980 [Agromyces tropicus]|uniref:DUF2304 domain-containing protein n=1 Tax=Agromyces tropicus TaxID=555371 RepID=A0ABP5G950_9MICO